MELILISDSKLKIMLNRQDMEHYELCNEEIDYDSTETRRAFWQILDEAKHKTGFDAASERVFIQLYPSRGGGCEMYVTKLGIIPASPEETQTYRAETATEPRREIRTAEVRVGKIACYLFRLQNEMLRVCAILAGAGYRDESSAYLLDDGRYALVIREYRHGRLSFAGAPDTYSFIEEFGIRERGGVRGAYLKEHGTCLSETDAVHTLGALV